MFSIQAFGFRVSALSFKAESRFCLQHSAPNQVHCDVLRPPKRGATLHPDSAHSRNTAASRFRHTHSGLVVQGFGCSIRLQHPALSASPFRLSFPGFRVRGLGGGVRGSRFRIWDLGLRVNDAEFRVRAPPHIHNWFIASDLGAAGCGLGWRVEGAFSGG